MPCAQGALEIINKEILRGWFNIPIGGASYLHITTIAQSANVMAPIGAQ